VPRLNAIEIPHNVACAIEELAMRAWPARTVHLLHGWHLAFGDGLTRRINSVQAVDWDEHARLDDAVHQVEGFYLDRGLPSRFRVTAVSRPEGLDQCLAGRGYVVEAPSDVLLAETGRRQGGAMRDAVSIARAAGPEWRRLWLAQGGDEDARLALLGRLPAGTIFALARTASEPSGIGLAVLDQGWAGIFAMHTAKRFRGQGVATAVLDALIAQATAMGVRRLYLQVEQGNEPAQRLYRRAGFGFAYRYHYRRASAAART
jgi:ribosomal protein S18 acetylase RimI-like enzyme